MDISIDDLREGHRYIEDADRLSALHTYTSLGTMSESIFDDLTLLAARACRMPIATITLVDRDHQCYISRYGTERKEAPIDYGFCPIVVINGQPLVLSDAAGDARFKQNPAVVEEAIRFYAGVPLVSPNSHIIGTVCVIDTVPRQREQAQIESLEAIARQVIIQLELRLTDYKVKRATQALTQVSVDVAAEIGDTFFSALVQQLSAALSVDCAYIAFICEDQAQRDAASHNLPPDSPPDSPPKSFQLETLAVCRKGQLVDNFTYSSSDGPCEHVLTRNAFCYHEQNLQARHLSAPPIGASDNDSYAAISIVDSAGRPVGVLAIIDAKPLKAPQIIEALLTIFSLRISTEIERHRFEDRQLELLGREREARRQTASASRTKDDFLAVVSHELRSPLNPILGWAQLLRRGNISAESTDKALEVIERNVLRQVELIDDLLDISCILRGKLALKAAPVCLNEIVETVVKAFQPNIQQKSIQFCHRNSADKVIVIGDKGRLQQIVENLLSNAMKFTPEGGEIDVTLTVDEKCAQLQVKDSGRGISPDFLPSIFEHFRQEDYSTIRQFGGLGLGLAIVHHLVTMHKGTISASSPGEGKGATFLVKVPLLPTKHKIKKRH